MDVINNIKDWVVPVSSCIALLTISLGAWLSLREYRLKLKSEARLSHSEQVEADIRLLTLFTEIMNIAHARGKSLVSEKTIEEMFDKNILKKDDYTDLVQLNKKIATASVLTLPVGVSAQEAAIAAIAMLAKRHDVLKEPAIAGLKSLSEWLPAAKKHLHELEELRNSDPE